MPTVAPLVTNLVARLENCTKHLTQSAKLYADVILQIGTAELVISRARSLKLKFACDKGHKDNAHLDSFVSQLMTQEEVSVLGGARGPVGKVLTEMFSESKVCV